MTRCIVRARRCSSWLAVIIALWLTSTSSCRISWTRWMNFSSVSSLCRFLFFFFSSRRRHTRFKCDWSSDVCSSDLLKLEPGDTLVLFSDGVTEAVDPDEQMFGTPRLKQLLTGQLECPLEHLQK